MTTTTSPTATDAGMQETPDRYVPEFQADPELACGYNPPVSFIPTGGCLHTGISLRDHFATHTIVGLVSNSDNSGSFEPIISYLINSPEGPATFARMAYELADAMLNERQKPIRPALSAATKQEAGDAGSGCAEGEART